MANDAFMRMISEIDKQLKEMQDEMMSRLWNHTFTPDPIDSVRDSFRIKFAHMYSPA